MPADFQVFGQGNVRPHRVRHDPTDPAFLTRRPDGRVTFRVLAPPEAVEAAVVIRVGDDIDPNPLTLLGSAGAVSLWELTLAPPAPRFSYSLALRLDDGTAVYVAPTGVASGIERLDRFDVDVAALPSQDVPDWMRGAVVYQVFPDRFANGDPANDPAGTVPWGSRPDNTTVMGGDLTGISAHVDHLVGLGVDVVYTTPVFTSPSNHKYDATDYRSVDPAFGGDEALRAMIDTLHTHGIKVVLDVSINHAHPSFFAFRDLCANGPSSPYRDWFVVDDWPPRVIIRPALIEPGDFWDRHLAVCDGVAELMVEEVDDAGPPVQTTYQSWCGVPTMPRVDLRSPEARRYMIDVVTHWIEEFGIDGWRMDVVRYVDHDVWQDVRAAARSVKPDAFLLAEVMGDARRWLRGDEFDATMNYTFRELCVDYFATGAIDTPTFLEGFLELLAMYPPDVTAVNHNLLGSHDTPRFLTLAGGDTDRLMLATLFQLTVPGAPGLYYGDELPMEGGPDPDNRRGFDWDAVGGPHHRAVANLGTLRRHHPALRTGGWQLIDVAGDAFAYQRAERDDRVTVVVNRGGSPATLTVDAERVLWAHGRVEPGDRNLTVGPRSGAVLHELHGQLAPPGRRR